ncbi:MAG TPA: ABC transporter permease subunit [Anaerolineaceae bacterium]|nr:ABC transporter permease subunit [Anaerolineaceae bacterium]
MNVNTDSTPMRSGRNASRAAIRWSNIWAIARKDWIEVSKNTSAWMPMLIVPLLFVLVIPGLVLGFSHVPDAAEVLYADPDLAVFLNNLPPVMQRYTQGLDFAATGMVIFLGFFFAPFFLIMPIMFSSVIAADSFAGEMERKTLEALLYTPLTDAELFLGKVVAAGLPALVYTWASFLVYTLVVNVFGYSLIGRIWFPLPTWYPLIFWITPAIALLGIAATVLISVKVKTFMGAYQSGGSLVLIVVALMVGQITGVLYLSVTVGLVLGLVFWVAAAVLMALAIRAFNRRTILVAAN